MTAAIRSLQTPGPRRRHPCVGQSHPHPAALGFIRSGITMAKTTFADARACALREEPDTPAVRGPPRPVRSLAECLRPVSLLGLRLNGDAQVRATRTTLLSHPAALRGVQRRRGAWWRMAAAMRKQLNLAGKPDRAPGCSTCTARRLARSGWPPPRPSVCCAGTQLVWAGGRGVFLLAARTPPAADRDRWVEHSSARAMVQLSQT
jgi:hypothetical protein